MFRYLIGVLALFVSVTSFAQHWNERHQIHMHIGERNISVTLFERLLQTYTNATYGTAFRYLGDQHDLYHGHLLYTDNPEFLAKHPPKNGFMAPFAILYHTQEHASRFSKEDPGGKYDYLDRETRNWVQFIDHEAAEKGLIINAYELMKDSFPNTPEAASSLSATLSHYTVFTQQLDYNKFPENFRYNVIGQVQAEFVKNNCQPTSHPLLRLYELGVIRIFLPQSHEATCLNLSAQVGYMPVEQDDGLGDRLPNPRVL